MSVTKQNLTMEAYRINQINKTSSYNNNNNNNNKQTKNTIIMAILAKKLIIKID